MRMHSFASWVVGLAILATGQAQASTTITFDDLPGGNGDPFTGPYLEDGFSVDPTAGDWFVAKLFGNPIPDLFAGPIGSPSLSELTITKVGGGTFSFLSSDLSSNGGRSAYNYLGYLGGSLLYATGGFIPTGAGFLTFGNPNSPILIDTLLISLDPVGAPSSLNLDNIVLDATVVPEPSTLALAAFPALLFLAHRVRKGTAL